MPCVAVACGAVEQRPRRQHVVGDEEIARVLADDVGGAESVPALVPGRGRDRRMRPSKSTSMLDLHEREPRSARSAFGARTT